MLYLTFFRFDFKQKKAEDFSSALVQMGRLELPHLTAPDPKCGVSTNSTTPAFQNFFRLLLV